MRVYISSSIDCVKYAKVEDVLKRTRRPAYLTGKRDSGIKSARELCVRETHTVRAAGGKWRREREREGSAGRRGRGIASGAKIRFARCRLHPRSIATHLYPPARRLHSNHPERATRFPSTSPRGPLLYPLSPHSPLPLPLSRSATVPRKLERAPPFDPADSHPPSHPTTIHPSVDLTPSPMAPRSFPSPLPTKRIQLLPTVSFSATRYDISILAPCSPAPFLVMCLSLFLSFAALPIFISLPRMLLEDTATDK